MQKEKQIQIKCHSPFEREGAPSTWRERAECVSTGVRGKIGFTLIELLVVILIIGILAAIAVPQYQKTIEKSKGMEALSLVRAIANAQRYYYMQHGKYAAKFADLDVVLPWSGNTKFLKSTASDTRSNKDWSAQFETYNGSTLLYIVRIKGKYAGAGFTCNLNTTPTIYCFERKKDANFIFNSSLGEGAYCEKILHAKKRPESTSTWNRYYFL